ncbi:MAG: glycosyltransferase family 9 protein [Thermodesulfobacteriota bacterium]
MTLPGIEKCNNILFIRRDNIGDLVCTTPAIKAVRQKYPGARISLLVNSYNAEVVRNNPDINDIYVYEKGKHRGNKGRLSVLAANAGLMRRIRAEKFDCAIGCSFSYSPRLARYTSMTKARLRIGYAAEGKVSKIYNCPVEAPAGPLHEVEAVMGLLAPLGITGPAPALSVTPNPGTLQRVKKTISKGKRKNPLIAFHISSRRPENRWPVESFAELIKKITAAYNVRPLVLWSPGAADNPLHPGDDESAKKLGDMLGNNTILFKTKTLGELIAALSAAEMAVCLDGGAMHLAAGLGKAVLTIWGSTDPAHWAPWGVENIILRSPEGRAAVVSANEAFTAFEGFGLIKELRNTGGGGRGRGSGTL